MNTRSRTSDHHGQKDAPSGTARTRTRREPGAKCLCCGKRHGDGAPWWYDSKSGWFITVGKSRKLLAKGDSVEDIAAHDKAMAIWKAGNIPGEADSTLPVATGDGENLTVEQLCDLYLGYLKRTAEDKTVDQCSTLFRQLCDGDEYAKGLGQVTVGQLRKDGVSKIKAWATAHNWNGSLATVYQRIKAVFNFAAGSDDSEESVHLIDSSPIKKLNTGKNRVKHRKRDSFFSQEQIDAILAYCAKSSRCPQFGLAFRVLIATGTRPEEFCGVTAADVKIDDRGNLYWWVEHKNQKHTGTRRRVYLLTNEMVAITKEQMAKYPEGPLFRNGWDRPWTVNTLLNQLREICRTKPCQKLGLDEHVISNQAAITKAQKAKLTPPKPRREYRYVTYSTRHTFGYRWYNGYYDKELSAQRVADLMGNTAAEVERTYGHADQGTPAFVSGLLN